MDIEKVLKQSLKGLGVASSPDQIRTVKEYLDIVYEYNKKVNLTGTKKKEDILIRHFLDSISILKFKKDLFKNNRDVEKILDVGTGAGLPAWYYPSF